MTKAKISPAVKGTSIPNGVEEAKTIKERREVESHGLSTLDGLILTENAKALAIKQGSGVVVGDYFVGISTAPDLPPPPPTILY